MTTAWVDGVNIGWVIDAGILIFLVGVSGVLAIFIIPGRVDLGYARENLFILGVLVTLAGLIVGVIFSQRAVSMDELQTGKYWITECQPVEMNIPTETLAGPVNKLDCAGVIIRVPDSQFKVWTQQWQLYESKRTGKY